MAAEQRASGGAFHWPVSGWYRHLKGLASGAVLGVVAAVGLAMGIAPNGEQTPRAKPPCAKLKQTGSGCFVFAIPRDDETAVSQAAIRGAEEPKLVASWQLGSHDDAKTGGGRPDDKDSADKWRLGPAVKAAGWRRPLARGGAAVGYAVQVGAYFNKQKAIRGWREITRAAPDLLQDLPRRIVEANGGTGQGMIYRLRAGPVASRAAGKDLCARLDERGIACFVVALGQERSVPEPPIHAAEREPEKPAPDDLVVALEPDAWRSASARPLWHWQVQENITPRPRLSHRTSSDRGTSVASIAKSYDRRPIPRASRAPRRTKQGRQDLRKDHVRRAMSGLLYDKIDTLSGGRAQSRAAARQAGYGRRQLGDPASQLASVRAGDEAFARPVGSGRLLTAQYQTNDGTGSGQSEEVEDESRLSDKPVPFKTEGDIPDRPPLLLEIGDPFLDTGELDGGLELPTGAVWQPRLWVFGTLRSAVQTIDTGVSDRVSEWVNRFDLFANLQLTGTEKAVLGIRPFDENRLDGFSGYRFEPRDERGFKDNLNSDIRTLFVEGDFGSLFPALDPVGQSLLDFGFTVGRQPLVFQDGILISDTVDAAGLVRNNIRVPGVSNLRVAAVYGWDGFNETTRSAGGIGVVDDEDLQLAGLFTEWDLPQTTINLDGIYVWDDTQADGDGFYAGVSAAQRLGEFNTTFRVNGSLARREQTVLVRDGVLVSSELSWTPYGTNDTAYFNPFVAFGEYLQAAREEIDGGGPLAPLGILFASPNIGEYGSEMVNRANDVGGVALGYQAFWDDNRGNLALEFALRKDLGLDSGANASLDGFDQYGLGLQLQQAIGQRLLFQLEGYGVLQEDRDDAYGGRAEFLYQF